MPNLLSVEGTLRWEGDVWTAELGGRVARLRDSRGLRHLAALLAQPGREVHALDLAGSPGAPRSEAAGPLLDDRARGEYRQRLAELAEDLDEATGFNDVERAARIQAEIDALVDQLTAATGLGGRDRGAVTDAERARVAVRRAVKIALDRIAEVHPELGAHLAATVRTGTFCAYVPDPASPVRWRVTDRGEPVTTADAAPRRRARPNVVGRAAEQAVLRAAWARGGVVLVAGEPGIGKTTLVDDLAATVDVALVGRCDDHLGAPYQPVVEWLRAIVATDGLDAVRADAGPALPPLARLVPELGTAGEGELDRLVLFDAVTRVVGAAAARRRVLLAVDDLHWAPQPTLSLLTHLARAIADAPALLVLTYRDTEVGDDLRSFLAALSRLEDVVRVDLRGLDIEGVRALGADDDDAKRLVEHTGGNPLFVRALIGSRHDEELPVSIVDVVGDRVARLSIDARKLVALLAVAGDRVEVRVAMTLGSLDALDELLLAGLLVEDGSTVGFPHALVRRAIEQSVSGVRRAALHVDVARAMEAAGASPATLAFHYVAAVPVGDAADAVRHCIAAAEVALRAGAFEEALIHAERGLQNVDDDTHDHAVLLLRLAEARHSGGDLAAARIALDEGVVIARRLRDAALLADMALERGVHGAQVGVHEPEVVAALEEALDAIGDTDPRRRVRVLARLAIEMSGAGRVDDARRLAADALELARSTDDHAVIIDALRAFHHVHDAPEHLELREATITEIESRADALGDLTAKILAIAVRIITGIERGHIDAADRDLAELARLVQLQPSRHQQWYLLEQQVVRAVIAGELDDAERLAERELSVAIEAAVANAFRGYSVQLFVIRDEQGRAGELADLAVTTATQEGRTPGYMSMAAVALIEAGRIDEARELFSSVDLRSMTRDSVFLGALCAASRVAMALSDVERAAVIDEQLHPFAGRICSIALGTIAIGPIDRYLSYTARTLGDSERARRHLLDAITLDERMRAARWLERDRADLNQLTRETRTSWA